MTNPLDTYVERSVEAVLQDVLPGWVAAGHTIIRRGTPSSELKAVQEQSPPSHCTANSSSHQHFRHWCMHTSAVNLLTTRCRLKCRCFFGHQQLPGGSFVALQRCAQVRL